MHRSREAELVAMAARGDQDAASELIVAHQGRLFAFMLRMSGSRLMAEEVVQEAFVRALRSLERFNPEYRFSTWLFTIARHVYLNMREKKKPQANTDLLGKVAPAAPVWALAGWTSERAESAQRWRDELQGALMDLPEAQREVVILFHQQDWPIWLISETLGMPEGTVKSYLHRGRGALRHALAAAWEREERGGEAGEVKVVMKGGAPRARTAGEKP